MTPPASPFPPKTAEQMKLRRASVAAAERQSRDEMRGNGSEVADAKVVACELINESWKDITATKST